jgi:hypothetical protein
MIFSCAHLGAAHELLYDYGTNYLGSPGMSSWNLISLQTLDDYHVSLVFLAMAALSVGM